MPYKLISIWGSSGAGKSTAALALAANLTKDEKNVVVINTDTVTPSLPVFLPELKTSSLHSIGGLYSSLNLTGSNLKDKIHLHPKNERLGFMGMCSGETPLTYKVLTKERLKEMMGLLSNMPLDYVIVDGASFIMGDTLSMFSLEFADSIIRVITPDVKGIEYEKSNMLWLRNSFLQDNHIKVLSPVKESSPVAEVEQVSGEAKYYLPYSEEVQEAFLSGSLISGMKYTTGILFEETIAKIGEEVK